MKQNVVFDYNDINFSLIQLSKIVQLGWSADNLLGLLMKYDLPLMVNNLNPLAKSILLPLGLTAAT